MTAEDWLRDIAANGHIMSVSLRDGGVGDLMPSDIAEVLATLDAARANTAALDVERLARALFARYALGHVAFPCGEDTEVEAAAIAKAYREATDATD